MLLLLFYSRIRVLLPSFYCSLINITFMLLFLQKKKHISILSRLSFLQIFELCHQNPTIQLILFLQWNYWNNFDRWWSEYIFNSSQNTTITDIIRNLKILHHHQIFYLLQNIGHWFSNFFVLCPTKHFIKFP